MDARHLLEVRRAEKEPKRVVRTRGSRMKRSLKAILTGRLKAWELKLASGFYDIIGDVAVIKLPEPSRIGAQ